MSASQITFEPTCLIPRWISQLVVHLFTPGRPRRGPSILAPLFTQEETQGALNQSEPQTAEQPTATDSAESVEPDPPREGSASLLATEPSDDGGTATDKSGKHDETPQLESEQDGAKEPDEEEDPDQPEAMVAPAKPTPVEEPEEQKELILTRDSCVRRFGPFSVHGYFILTNRSLRFRPRGGFWGLFMPEWLVDIPEIQPASGISPDGAAMIWVQGNTYRFEGRGAVRIVEQVQVFLHELAEGRSLPTTALDEQGEQASDVRTEEAPPSVQNLAANVRPSTDALGVAKKIVLQPPGSSSFRTRKCAISKEGKNLHISLDTAPPKLSTGEKVRFHVYRSSGVHSFDGDLLTTGLAPRGPNRQQPIGWYLLTVRDPGIVSWVNRRKTSRIKMNDHPGSMQLFAHVEPGSDVIPEEAFKDCLVQDLSSRGARVHLTEELDLSKEGLKEGQVIEFKFRFGEQNFEISASCTRIIRPSTYTKHWGVTLLFQTLRSGVESQLDRLIHDESSQKSKGRR